MTNTREPATRCGHIAIVGRPNVGKSTLLNHLLRQKISITSRKPQTTRTRILGISTTAAAQCIYVDTPGLDRRYGKAINRMMNETVMTVVNEVDVIMLVSERLRWDEQDEAVLQAVREVSAPALLVINKVDQLRDKRRLLPHIERLAAHFDFAEIMPVSALGGHNLELLETRLREFLPESPFLFPGDQVTDVSSRFLAAELIREKITRQLGDELPYEVMVEIEKFASEKGAIQISALITVEKQGQKRILIGSGGQRLKLIGAAARKDMEQAFESKVSLQTWVRVGRRSRQRAKLFEGRTARHGGRDWS